ncbi:MAG: hypothetical protein LIO75_02320 [Lachnospiraceae bacterium]|nr:hypothetical protein [Lachnospiraceae bacterium]
MYKKLPHLVLGFHGCRQDIFENVIYHGERLKASSNAYDWLGHGIYFWEQNYQRAYEWAGNRYADQAASLKENVCIRDLNFSRRLMFNYVYAIQIV